MKVADWMRVLDQLDDSLKLTAVEIAKQEQALASPLLSSDLSDERHISWQRALERFGDRLRDSQAHVDLAERQSREDETTINEQQEELDRFHQTMADICGKLAHVPSGV
jgi:hypothetical protein